ncbi:MAG: pyruvate dehydrogenase (acetyl-transferring) E1 component subunit alpha [Actinomycetota bacterium]
MNSPRGDGDPDQIQLLTPDGQLLFHPDYSPYLRDLSPEHLRSFYRDLIMVRRFDTEAITLQRQGELGLWPSLVGQEAAQVGAGRALAAQDYVFPTYREHGVAWCRGVDLLNVLGLFRGVHHGGWDPKRHHFHLYTLVLGTQVLHATGYAMGMQRDHVVASGDPHRDAAVLACFGDGATSQGDVNEAFVFAAVQNAPVVFFCQNNQWAISEPAERQTRIPLYQRASGFGFPGVQVDGNDVLGVYAVTKAALEQARNGGGPTLIEAFTYRMGAHTTSDDPSRYRDEQEVEAWRRRDPIVRFRTHLLGAGLFDQDMLKAMEEEAEQFAAELRQRCRSLPDPQPADMFAHVYAHDHPLINVEQQALADSSQGSDHVSAP